MPMTILICEDCVNLTIFSRRAEESWEISRFLGGPNGWSLLSQRDSPPIESLKLSQVIQVLSSRLLLTCPCRYVTSCPISCIVPFASLASLDEFNGWRPYLLWRKGCRPATMSGSVCVHTWIMVKQIVVGDYDVFFWRCSAASLITIIEPFLPNTSETSMQKASRVLRELIGDYSVLISWCPKIW